MTFEDYKEHFEKFSKIDTAEKLAFCKSQHEKHLLHLEDEQFFEPLSENLGNDEIGLYEEKLHNILNLDKIKENQFHFLVRPSFKPENLLTIECKDDCYLLTHVALTHNFWDLFYTSEKIGDLQKVTVSATFNKKIGDKLFLVLDNVMAEARPPKANSVTIDGIYYSLSRLYSEGQKTVIKCSPSENSKSGKTIEILRQLIDNIQCLDDTTLANIEMKISELVV